MLDDNRDFLVNEFVKITSLNGRYEQVECVNWPLASGEEKRGYFSLVFKALDNTTGKNVAIKVMDPSHLGDDYRINCFKREPKILTEIIGKKRCLQLVDEMRQHYIKVALPNGHQMDFPCDYFVTDWLDYNIDDYFLSKETFSSTIKLITFRHIVSSVEAIHSSNIFHRDLKPDNMRTDSQNIDDRFILVIDFGTAAQYDSGKLMPDYGYQVGHTMYSAPETFLGFAGERSIAKYTDVYALGCMLYELFNDSLYFTQCTSNANFGMALTALGFTLSAIPTIEEKIKCYNGAVGNYARMVEPPDFFGFNCTLPGCISGVVTPLYKSLVHFDYNKRLYNFDVLRTRIDKAIRALANEEYQKRSIEKRRIFKINAIRKAEEKQLRLNNYLNSAKRISC